ncbi:unnamed protein product [Moneuplotes crassus]|uniref:Uncharacterized protein n=1 Tax=Euplotes crassus TaxID=5936 RepID=A0AAD2D932_EUPCR|nr:unnamed protein product [Moneuplotes crassus]
MERMQNDEGNGSNTISSYYDQSSDSSRPHEEHPSQPSEILSLTDIPNTGESLYYSPNADISLGEDKSKLEEEKSEVESEESEDTETSEESEDGLAEIEGVEEEMSGIEVVDELVRKVERMQELRKRPDDAKGKVNKAIKKALKRIKTEEGNYVLGINGDALLNSFWQALRKTDFDHICTTYEAYSSTNKFYKLLKKQEDQTKKIKKECEKSKNKSESFKAGVGRKLKDLKGVLEEKKLNGEMLALVLDSSIKQRMWQKTGVEGYFSSVDNRELVEKLRNQIIKDFMTKACTKSLSRKEFTNKLQTIFEKISLHQEKVLDIILKQAKIIQKEYNQPDQAQKPMAVDSSNAELNVLQKGKEDLEMKLQKTIEEHSKEISDFKAKNLQLNEEKNDLEQKNKQIQNETSKTNDLKAEIERLQSELAQEKKQKLIKDKANEILKSKNDQLQTDLKKMEEVSKENSSESPSEAQNSTSLSTLQSENACLKTNLAAAKAKIEELELSKTDLSDQLESFKSDYLEMTAEVKQFESQFKGLMEECEEKEENEEIEEIEGSEEERIK